MRWYRWMLALAVVGLSAVVSHAAEPKRLLLVTDSGGFIHDSVGTAEEVLKKVGPKAGLQVDCFRYTRDPAAKGKFKKKINGKDMEVEGLVFDEYQERFRARTGMTIPPESCGRVNAATLKKYDAVLFYTTGNPLNEQEVKDLVEWVNAGGAVAGVHSGSDTLYPAKDKPWNAMFGDLIGGYFDGHPWHKKVKLTVEDTAHPATRGFKTGDEITDEIYQFRAEPYSREKLHILISIDNSTIEVEKGKRADKDYAVAWCREVGKGRSFYTSLGHRKEVWQDERYQTHLINGLRWALKLEEGGSAAPSGKK